MAFQWDSATSGLLGAAIGAGAALVGGYFEFKRRVRREEEVRRQTLHDTAMREARDACFTYMKLLEDFIKCYSFYSEAVIKNKMEKRDSLEMEHKNAVTDVVCSSLRLRLICPPIEENLKKISDCVIEHDEIIYRYLQGKVSKDVFFNPGKELRLITRELESKIKEVFKDYLIPVQPDNPPE